MDQKQVGKFIAEQRKVQGYTQLQLAEILHVSDRTISKWERGAGMPDMNSVKPLCDALHITADELLQGLRDENDITIIGANDSADTEQDSLRVPSRYIRYMVTVIIVIVIVVFSRNEIRNTILSLPLTNSQIENFIEQSDLKIEYVDIEPVGSVDKFKSASEQLSSFYSTAVKAIDKEVYSENGRYRIIRYDFGDIPWKDKVQKYNFINAYHYNRKESKSWIPWKHSLSSKYHWKDDLSGAYTYVWCDKYGLTVLLTENEDYGEKIVRAMKKN